MSCVGPAEKQPGFYREICFAHFSELVRSLVANPVKEGTVKYEFTQGRDEVFQSGEFAAEDFLVGSYEEFLVEKIMKDFETLFMIGETGCKNLDSQDED